MRMTPYDADEVRQLWDALAFLTLKQQRLARALIAAGLATAKVGSDHVRIEVLEPDEDDRGGPLDVQELFDRAMLPGHGIRVDPPQQSPELGGDDPLDLDARKVGGILRIELPPRNG